MGKEPVALFKQFVESGSRILHFGYSGRGFALDGFAGFKKGTVVSDILLWNALGDRFTALEPRAGIEAHAILTGVKIAVALWALCIKRDPVDLDIDHCSAE